MAILLNPVCIAMAWKGILYLYANNYVIKFSQMKKSYGYVVKSRIYSYSMKWSSDMTSCQKTLPEFTSGNYGKLITIHLPRA